MVACVCVACKRLDRSAIVSESVCEENECDVCACDLCLDVSCSWNLWMRGLSRRCCAECLKCWASPPCSMIGARVRVSAAPAACSIWAKKDVAVEAAAADATTHTRRLAEAACAEPRANAL